MSSVLLKVAECLPADGKQQINFLFWFTCGCSFCFTYSLVGSHHFAYLILSPSHLGRGASSCTVLSRWSAHQMKYCTDILQAICIFIHPHLFHSNLITSTHVIFMTCIWFSKITASPAVLYMAILPKSSTTRLVSTTIFPKPFLQCAKLVVNSNLQLYSNPFSTLWQQ